MRVQKCSKKTEVEDGGEERDQVDTRTMDDSAPRHQSAPFDWATDIDNSGSIGTPVGSADSTASPVTSTNLILTPTVHADVPAIPIPVPLVDHSPAAAPIVSPAPGVSDFHVIRQTQREGVL